MSEESTSSVISESTGVNEVLNSVENQIESSENLEATSEEESSNEEQSEDSEKASKEVKKEIERKLKKLKLKVDGQEIEEEIDLDDEDYLKNQLQLAKAAQKRMQEKAELEKQTRAFIDELRKNPRKMLESDILGLNFKELVDQYVNEELEKAAKSPEQLEKERLMQELEELKAKQQKELEEREAAEFERLQQQKIEEYDRLFEQALDKNNLPKTPYIVKKMASYMHTALKIANENSIDIEITPNDVAPLVVEEMKKDLRDMFATMPEDVIEQFVGKDIINKVRKKDLEKAKKIKPVSKIVEPVIETPTQKKTFKDFFGV